MKQIAKVLIVATSKKTRGGITAVVKAHEQGEQWQKFQCRWIETHIDKGCAHKLLYFIKAIFMFITIVPFYDIVHIHTSEPPSAIRKCFFLFPARLWRKKVIIHLHAFSPDTTINSKYRVIYHYLFRHSDRIVLLSEYWRNKVTETFQLGNKAIVIYNPCTAIMYPEKYQKEKKILYAGTLNARKGYADMIQAFSIIAQSFPDWKIVFAGNGEIEQGKVLAEKYHISQQTEFAGWVDGSKKDKIFKESMFFCLPSYAEGFPMAVLDAWSYRLPVITTPVGGIPDIAIDKTNLLLFEPGNVNKLSLLMKTLMTDKELYNSMTKESMLLSETTFNIKTINKKVETLYEELLR